MRADMAKVIVERPRLGSTASSRGKGYLRRLQRCAAEEQPRREAMKRRSGGTKHFNEHLGPLRRFLESCVGRPWNKVFAEICERISRNSVVQDHVRDHVFDFVTTNVVLLDGVPCIGKGLAYGSPLARVLPRQCSLYVCPATGLLKRLPPRSKRKEHSIKPAPYVRIDEYHQCRRIDGTWHLVELKPLPGTGLKVYDVVLQKWVWGYQVWGYWERQMRRVYGAVVYAVSKRPLSKKEIRHLPVSLATRAAPDLVRR